MTDTHVVSALKTLLAVTLSIAAIPAHGATLCGKQFASRRELEASLRQSPTAQVYDRDKQVTVIWEGSNRPPLTLWWFTKVAHPAFPAAICIRQIERGSHYAHLPAQSDCGSAPQAACKALAKEMAKAKF